MSNVRILYRLPDDFQIRSIFFLQDQRFQLADREPLTDYLLGQLSLSTRSLEPEERLRMTGTDDAVDQLALNRLG